MRVLILTKKRLAAIAAGVLAAACLVSIPIVRSSGSVPVQSAEKLLPIYNVDTQEKKIALTFDAAWGNEDTQQIIRILEEYQAKATFFIVGEWADRYPDDVRALAQAGHSIQNHSNTHPHMPKLSGDAIAGEITGCNQQLEQLCGKKPIYFRAPYGDYDNTTVSGAQSLNMQTIQWDVDSLDWKGLIASDIADRVVKKVQPGSIILCHNGAKHIVEALPLFIGPLQAQGYRFVTLEELILPDSYTIDANGTQHFSNPPSPNTQDAAPISE